MQALISELIYGLGNETPIYIGITNGNTFEVYVSSIVAGLIFVIAVYSIFRIIGMLLKVVRG